MNNKRSGNGRREVACHSCAHWRPHIFYPILGLCSVRGVLTFEDDWCEHYKPLSYGEDRFYWCVTCRMRLTAVEAREHASRGHKVYLSGYIDPDVREEIYDAF